jgi:hypothetical protein
VTRGGIYRTSERAPERGGKPGFYVVVSQPFIAESDDVGTVICAPVYSQILEAPRVRAFHTAGHPSGGSGANGPFSVVTSSAAPTEAAAATGAAYGRPVLPQP